MPWQMMTKKNNAKLKVIPLKENADPKNGFIPVTMDSDKAVVANFVKKKYALTINVEGEGSVTDYFDILFEWALNLIKSR